MGGYTENLDLYYSVFPDDDSDTFNFDVDLKNNWDKLDAFAGEVLRLVSDNEMPVGTVIQGYYRQAPDGFLKLDGSSVSKETYSRLYQHLQDESLYGEGLPFHDDPVSPSTHFILQDVRADFLRNWDDGRGVDSGRALGSWQEDELREHSHSYKEAYIASHQHGPTTDYVYISHTRNANTGLTGGSETRPRNIALTACIKY